MHNKSSKKVCGTREWHNDVEQRNIDCHKKCICEIPIISGMPQRTKAGVKNN